MQVVREGVTYLLDDFAGDNFQRLRFTTKVRGEFINGTTVEEVLSVLIHKVEVFQQRSPSEENLQIINHLKRASELMSARLRRKLKKLHEDNSASHQQDQLHP
jgi:hypothetical protein